MGRYQDEFPEEETYDRPLRAEVSSIPNLPVEQSTKPEEDNFKDLIEFIDKSWMSREDLELRLIQIAELYKKTADELGDAISSLSSTFIGEKDLEPSMTVTEADHRAKQAFGGEIERLRGRLESLNHLHRTIMHRVSVIGLKQT
jgi:hypothetical protein